ncbi:hypothetical protein TNCV_358571 [Trichonephila clavipes]|nr:hypothetical protein TNCV_358571 [Trichonephila clavipes]
MASDLTRRCRETLLYKKKHILTGGEHSAPPGEGRKHYTIKAHNTGYVDTLTGKDTLHDTVGIIYQNVSHDYDIELNSSSISGNIDIPLPPTKEDGLLTRKFQNYRRLIIDC